MRLQAPAQQDRRAEDLPAETSPAVAPDQQMTPAMVTALQRSAGNAAVASMLQRQVAPADDMRVAEIDRQLEMMVITDEYRAQLETERMQLTGEAPARPIVVIEMSAEEYEALTGEVADLLPEGSMPGTFEDGAMCPVQPEGGDFGPLSTVPGGLGVGSTFTSQPNWYYRVLQSSDPNAATLLGGQDLLPRPRESGGAWDPAAGRADMTFRQMRAGGNARIVGTDRISTAANLDAIAGNLDARGSELIRVDVERARQLGAEFLERADLMEDLDEIGRQIVKDLAEARAQGRGKTHIKYLEKRLEALEAAKDYARGFLEGHGVERIPSGAISQVEGPSLAQAAKAEQRFLTGVKVFRYGGRVLLVTGIALSIARIESATDEERPRVIAQEAGGWGGSLAGGAAGAKAGAELGALLGFETGPGAVIAAGLGALIGGAIGFFGGEEAADAMYDAAEDITGAIDLLKDPVEFSRAATWMVGTPEEKRIMMQWEAEEYEEKYGEPMPWP